MQFFRSFPPWAFLRFPKYTLNYLNQLYKGELNTMTTSLCTWFFDVIWTLQQTWTWSTCERGSDLCRPQLPSMRVRNYQRLWARSDYRGSCWTFVARIAMDLEAWQEACSQVHLYSQQMGGRCSKFWMHFLALIEMLRAEFMNFINCFLLEENLFYILRRTGRA